MQLREYQREDVDRMFVQNCIGNFSEQRTGKTPTTCASLAQKGVKHTLIVCPNSLVYVWKDAWETWTGWPAQVIEETSFDCSIVPEDCALVVNFEKIRGTKKQHDITDMLLEWKPAAIVVDEAHRMKDRNSLTAEQLCRFIKVPIRIALTGTPAPNQPWEIWTILHWLFPDRYKSYWRFINDHFLQKTVYLRSRSISQPTAFKPGMATILQQNLNTLCIQHKRREIMQWLPEEQSPTVVKLPPSPEQVVAIEHLMSYFEYKHIITKSVLDNLVRVRQVCASPALLDLSKKISPKIQWLLDYLKDYPEKHVLVFSNSKKFLYLIQSHIKEPLGFICGDVPPLERVKLIEAYQKSKFRIMLCQTQACKEGITLDNADVSIFMDLYPPAADYMQAKDRMVATAPERVKPKEIIHVILQETYDADLFSLVQHNVNETAVLNDYKNFIKERRNRNGEQ